MRPTIELANRDLFTLGHDLHGAVGKISHPAVKALTGGRGADKEPEADALNSAVNQIVSPEAHAGTRRL